jgi:hypothetical protein
MTTTGTWYPPALGTGGFLHEGQLFTNPPFIMTTPSDITRLRDRISRQRHQPPERILQVVAAEILERHHQASAREIASLLLDAAGVEVGP